MTKSSPTRSMDALLTGLEQAVLASDGRELLAESPAEATETGAFIATRLAARGLVRSPASAPRRRSRRRIPRDATARRQLLSQLISMRPELPKRISLAFEAREPRDDEVAKLLEELLGMADHSGNE